MNTIKKGQVRFLIFKEKDDQLYTGVCLDFGIVVQGESADYVKYELEKGAVGYLKTIAKEKMEDKLLNFQAEKKYFDLYNKIISSESKNLKSNRATKAPAIGLYNDVAVNFKTIANLLHQPVCYA
jgi:hypothetical protein